MKKVVISAAAMLLVATVAFAGPKEDADGGPHGEGAGGLDCTTATYVTCGDTATGAGGVGGGVSLYGCTGLDYTGAEETVYELCVGGDGVVDLAMTYSHDGATNDLDLFLLGSCDPADCIDSSLGTSGLEEISAVLTAGTYYVVVDGWNGLQDGSPHSLTVTCDTPCSATPVLEATWGQIKALHSEK